MWEFTSKVKPTTTHCALKSGGNLMRVCVFGFIRVGSGRRLCNMSTREGGLNLHSRFSFFFQSTTTMRLKKKQNIQFLFKKFKKEKEGKTTRIRCDELCLFLLCYALVFFFFLLISRCLVYCYCCWNIDKYFSDKRPSRRSGSSSNLCYYYYYYYYCNWLRIIQQQGEGENTLG